MKRLNATETARALLLEKVAESRCLLDGTAGNGHDTLFLAVHSLPEAKVLAFDIQKEALEETARRLEEGGVLGKVVLIQDSHERLKEYLCDPIDVAMYNLGYRPGASHEVTTKADSTTAAIRQTLELLAPDGMLAITAYPGHPPGRIEQEAVEGLLVALPRREFSVGCWRMLNQSNDPPILYIVGKRGDRA